MYPSRRWPEDPLLIAESATAPMIEDGRDSEDLDLLEDLDHLEDLGEWNEAAWKSRFGQM